MVTFLTKMWTVTNASRRSPRSLHTHKIHVEVFHRSLHSVRDSWLRRTILRFVELSQSIASTYSFCRLC